MDKNVEGMDEKACVKILLLADGAEAGLGRTGLPDTENVYFFIY